MSHITSISIRRLVTTTPYETMSIGLTADRPAWADPHALCRSLLEDLNVMLAECLGPAALRRYDAISDAYAATHRDETNDLDHIEEQY